MQKPLRYFFVFSVGLSMVWLVLRQANQHPPPVAYSVPRSIQYRFTLQNRSNRLLKTARFWTHAPLEQTGTLRRVRLEASLPFKLISDGLGNKILEFTFPDIPPYATKIVAVRAQLLLAEQSNPSALGDAGAFLRQETFLETADPAIIKLAKELRGKSRFNTAERIFHWVSGNVRYTGYSRKARGALHALKYRQGDCTEFMYLFTALCRVNGLPARNMAGYLSKKNGSLKPADYHNWAEFYEAGAWKIADPQRGVFVQGRGQYIAMRIISGSQSRFFPGFDRFRYEGEGLSVKMH